MAAWRTGVMHQASAGHAHACSGTLAGGAFDAAVEAEGRRSSGPLKRSVSWHGVSRGLQGSLNRERWKTVAGHAAEEGCRGIRRDRGRRSQGTVAATTRHRKRHRDAAHLACGSGDRNDSRPSSTTKLVDQAGGVPKGRLPLSVIQPKRRTPRAPCRYVLRTVRGKANNDDPETRSTCEACSR